MEELLNTPINHLSIIFTKKKMLDKINIKEIDMRNDPNNNLHTIENEESKSKHSNSKSTSKRKNKRDVLNNQISTLSYLIDKYTHSSKKNLYIIKKLKEENQHLINELNAHILNKSFFSKTTEQVFQDLVDKYRKRGYKIPNLTIEKNLFAKNPLIIESKQDVDDYYKNSIKNYGEFIKDIDKYNEKNWVFLNKMKKEFVKSYDFTKILNNNNNNNNNENNNDNNNNSNRRKSKPNITISDTKPRSSFLNTAHIIYINSSEINEAIKNAQLSKNKLLLKEKKEKEDLIKDITNLKKLIKIEEDSKNTIPNTDNNKNYCFNLNCKDLFDRKSDNYFNKNKLFNFNSIDSHSNKSLIKSKKYKSNKKLNLKNNKIFSYQDRTNYTKKHKTLITSLNISNSLSNKSSVRNGEIKNLSTTEKIYKKIRKIKLEEFNTIENEVIQYLKNRNRRIPNIKKENLNTEFYYQLEDLRGKVKDGRVLANAKNLYCFGNAGEKHKQHLEELNDIENVINKIDKIYVKSSVNKYFD